MLQHVIRNRRKLLLLLPPPSLRSKDSDHSWRDRNSWRGSGGAPGWWPQGSPRTSTKRAATSSKTWRTYFPLTDGHHPSSSRPPREAVHFRAGKLEKTAMHVKGKRLPGIQRTLSWGVLLNEFLLLYTCLLGFCYLLCGDNWGLVMYMRNGI